MYRSMSNPVKVLIQRQIHRVTLEMRVSRIIYCTLWLLQKLYRTSSILGCTAQNDTTTIPSPRTSTQIAAECDIGKLLDAGKDLQQLSWEKYCILIVNPILQCMYVDPTSYSCTHPYTSGSFGQFQPAWLKQYPWLQYSKHVDGVFCHACVFFGPDKSWWPNSRSICTQAV